MTSSWGWRLLRGGGTQSTLQGVSIHHTIDGVLDLWMRGLEDLIEHVQIDAVALHVEFGAGQPEVKERHTPSASTRRLPWTGRREPPTRCRRRINANLQQGIGASL